jgi:hypothetical protein
MNAIQRLFHGVVLRLATGAAVGSLLLLAGCGGGGGGDQQSYTLSANFSVAEATASAVEGEGFPAVVRATVTLTYRGTRDIYIGVVEEEGLLANYSVDISGQPYKLEMFFKTGRLAGTYTSQLKLLACFDTACREQAPGSPLVLPIKLTVTPNLQVQPKLLLSRTGLEAAPGAKVKISTPPGAGTLSFASGGETDGYFGLALVGDELTVTTGQLPAGRYVRRVEFQASGGSVYRAGIDLEYVVNAPPGGQRALGFVWPDVVLPQVKQGDVFSQRFRVQRPTWIVDNAQPLLDDPTGLFRLRDLGGDEYEITANTAGVAVDTTLRATVNLNGTVSGAQQSAGISVSVGRAFWVAGGLDVTLDGTSTAAAFRLKAPVVSETGQALRWSARSLTPWVTVVRSAGVSGVDEIEVLVDPSAVIAQAQAGFGEIEVAVDRPNTSPQRVSVAVGYDIPRVGFALRGALLAGQNTLYLDGYLVRPYSVAACLSVTGATLRATTVLSDNRFVGAFNVLRLTLSDVVEGQDVVVRCTTPLLTTLVRVPVRAVPRVAAGYAGLPFNAWRSAQFAQGQDALFFAGNGVVARWAQTATGWAYTSRQMPGLIDAALYGDHSFLIGVAQAQAWRIDTASLATTLTTPFVADMFSRVLNVDPKPLAGMSALVFAADGAAYVASLQLQTTGDPVAASYGASGFFYPLTASIGNGTDPGSNGSENVPAGGPQSGGVVRSPGGAWVVGQVPSGRLRVHEAANRSPVFAEQLPPGVSLRGVSEDGTRRLRSDGVLHVGGNPVGGSLASRLPAGFVVGGYGLTGSGRHALVYGYRIVAEAAGPRAREAAVWVFDITDATSQGVALAPLLDRLVLADAVGCTTTLQANESCEHLASVTVAEGDQSAFVLGPRGVAAVPLPVALAYAGGTTPQGAARQRINIGGVLPGSGSR